MSWNEKKRGKDSIDDRALLLNFLQAKEFVRAHIRKMEASVVASPFQLINQAVADTQDGAERGSRGMAAAAAAHLEEVRLTGVPEQEISYNDDDYPDDDFFHRRSFLGRRWEAERAREAKTARMTFSDMEGC